MRIGEFSTSTGVSVHTLRYYEKIGLIENVQRDASGIRIYRPVDAEWIEWIMCLKSAGMTIDTIKQYSQLHALGDVAAQISVLEEHVEKAAQRVRELKSNLKVSHSKLQRLRERLT